MKVGESGDVHSTKCELGIDCQVLDKTSPSESGHVYFVSGGQIIHFVQVSAAGAKTLIAVKTQEKNAKKQSFKGATAEMFHPPPPEPKAAPPITLRKRPSVYAIQ